MVFDFNKNSCIWQNAQKNICFATINIKKLISN